MTSLSKMKFSKFPLLVQQEILDVMNMTELFLLTMCSKKIQKLICSMEKKRFDNIIGIEYLVSSDGDFYIISKTRNQGVEGFPVVRALKSHNEFFVSNVLGKQMKIIKSNNNAELAHENQKDQVIETIHEHLIRVIGSHLILHANLESGVYLPRLSKITSTDIIGDSPLEAKDLDHFLSASPNQESIRVMTKVVGDFSRNSAIFLAKSVDLECQKCFDLSYFRGKELIITVEEDPTQKVEQFLNEWKLNNVCPNLEYMFITADESSSDLETVDQTGTGNWLREREPHVFRFPTKPHNFIVTQYYVVREHDRRVASVSVVSGEFQFGVWDLTEEKFLEITEWNFDFQID